MAEVNSKDFDSERWLAGSDVRRVYAGAANFKCRHVAREHPGFYDNAVAGPRFADARSGIVDAACPCHYE